MVGAVACFAIGIGAPQIDPYSGPYLPMGTHFIWHLMGGGAAFFGLTYVLQTETITPSDH